MAAQASFKERWLSDCLGRIAGVKTSAEPMRPSPRSLGYRTKAVFRVLRDERRLGMVGVGRVFLPVAEQCLIHVDPIRNLVPKVNELLQNAPENEPLPESVMMRAGGRTGQMQVIASFSGQPRRWMSHLKAGLSGKIQSLLVTWQRKERESFFGEQWALLDGTWTIQEKVSGFSFVLGAQDFFQTNLEQAEELHSFALAHLPGQKGEEVLDLGCGVGPFSLVMSRTWDRVIGVDVRRSSILRARENACQNRIANARFLSGDFIKTGRRLCGEGCRPGGAVADPARWGLGEDGCQAIHLLRPRRWVYISCHPVSLARDLKRISGMGYEVEKIVPFDMYPHTHHLETTVVFRRI
jgi:23S rRNA (uracil1939-C5)-methyltransferase